MEKQGPIISINDITCQAIGFDGGSEMIEKNDHKQNGWDKDVCPECLTALVRLGACFSCPICGYGGCN
jgi:hypothetical protein